MDKEEPSWKALELLVADIHSQLMPWAKITHDAKLTGLESEVDRQIDVLIEQTIGPYPIRIVVDCKDYRTPVDVKGVEEFAGLVNDVRAHAGAMVCPAGFTSTAKKRAKKLNISLFTPVDVAGGHRWSRPLALPTLCVFKKGGLGLQLTYDQPLPLRLPSDFVRETTLYDISGSRLGTPMQIASQRWDSGDLPLEVGQYEDIPLFTDGRKTFVDNGYGTRVPINLTILLSVTERCYYGKLPLANIRGLRDEHTGGVATNAFRTGELSPRHIENEWQRLKEGEPPPGPVSFTVQGLEAWQLPGTPIRDEWLTVRE